MTRFLCLVLCLVPLAIMPPGCAVEELPLEDDAETTGNAGGKADGGGYAIAITYDTFFKVNTDQSTELNWGSGKCRAYDGDEVISRSPPTRVGNHYRVHLTTALPDCEFTYGYFFVEHVDIGLTGPCHANVSVRECALLSTIAYAEGTDDRYDLIFSYQTFTSYADHPRRVVCSGGYCSDAAGRYQFLSTTWDWAAGRVGAWDFTPASQDRAALWLIRNRGVTWIDQIDTFGEFEDALYRLNQEWASLPGSPYGQPTHSASSLWSVYRAHAGL